MEFDRHDRESEYSSRRSVLAALGGAVAVGLAGCSGGEDTAGTPTPGSGDDTGTSTPDHGATADRPTQGGGDTTGASTPGGGGGTETPTPSGESDGSERLDIPGEVVHNGIDTAEVIAHGAYPVTSSEMNVRVTVANSGDQPLTPDPLGGAENPLFVRARTLTSDGNQLQIMQISSGPDEVSPGAEATLVSSAPADRSRVAGYELCLVPQDPLLQSATTDWEDVCGG